MRVDALAHAARDVGHGSAVVEAREGVGQLAQLVVSGRQQQLAVALEQRPQLRPLGEPDAILIAAHALQVMERQAAEVEEAERAPLDAPAAVGAHGSPMRQVPIGHVEHVVARDLHVGQQRGREVHPRLVDEQAMFHVMQTEASQARLPPAQERRRRGVETQADEAQVVDAREQDQALRGLARRRAAP